MSIENSFCRCNWNEARKIWDDSNSEDEFAVTFFQAEATEEISFPDAVAYHLVSWELLEDFSDWYRDRDFEKSEDWDHFQAAWKSLGLMESEEFQFSPVNELLKDEPAEFVFGALSPDSVREVIGHLEKIDGERFDLFLQRHQMLPEVLFSEQVAAMKEALDPGKRTRYFRGLTRIVAERP